MAIIITEPDSNNANLDEWRVFIQDLQIYSGGFLCIGLTNINNHYAPLIEIGSRFEVNGTKYKCTNDESIDGTPTNNAVNYIYAVPNENTASFEYGSTPAPVWNPAKGGWYNGNNRAIAKFYYSSNGPIYGNKVILDSYNAMQMGNKQYIIPISGGGLLYSFPGRATRYTLPIGCYYVAMQGGAGGKGGKVGVLKGGAGRVGETRFVALAAYNEPLVVYGIVGGDGNDGGDVAEGDNSWTNGGGGGCSGGSTVFVYLQGELAVASCMGGSGGGGAQNGPNDDDFCGGGGGGGYGIGGRGEETISGAAGRGGANGIGGAGGSVGFFGGKYSGGYGGGYPGGDGSPGGGYPGETDPGGYGGAGSGPLILSVADMLASLHSVYQGGGGGSKKAIFVPSSNGGSGLRSTSSGYARLYRVG